MQQQTHFIIQRWLFQEVITEEKLLYVNKQNTE